MESKHVPVVAALLLLVACYGEPQLPEPAASPEPQPEAATSADVSVEPERQGGPAEEAPGSQDARLHELAEVLQRLGPQGDETAREQRNGAASWRAAELEKLLEVTETCCAAGSAPCRACLAQVAAHGLPADELWKLMGRFLGDLRPRAEDGMVTLGASLLLRDNGVTRDRAFRVAVGSGAARRGDEDAGLRRGATIPMRPAEGERVLFVVEQPAHCPNVTVDLKGPTPAGRWDLDFDADCPEPAQQPEDLTVLRAKRAVWAFDAGPLPSSGFSLWLGGEQPLIEVKPTGTGPVDKP